MAPQDRRHSQFKACINLLTDYCVVGLHCMACQVIYEHNSLQAILSIALQPHCLLMHNKQWVVLPM